MVLQCTGVVMLSNELRAQRRQLRWSDCNAGLLRQCQSRRSWIHILMSSITDDGVPAYLKSLVNGADADDQATKDAHSSRAQVAPDTSNCLPHQPHLDNRGGDGGGGYSKGVTGISPGIRWRSSCRVPGESGGMHISCPHRQKPDTSSRGCRGR